MAPQRVKDSTANEQWLAFRRKHEEQLQSFHRDVERSKSEFERRVEAARTRLLEKHAKEEKAFWSRQDGETNAATAQKTGASRSQAQSIKQPSALPAKPASNQTAPKKSQQQPLKSSIASNKASQPVKQVKPAQSQLPLTKPPESRPTQKKITTPEVIDLCSDDEDDVPLMLRRRPASTAVQSAQAPALTKTDKTIAASEAQRSSNSGAAPSIQPEIPAFSIPSASLELFGGKSKSYYTTPEQLRVKREQSVFGEKLSGVLKSPPGEKQVGVSTPNTLSSLAESCGRRDSSPFNGFASWASSQRASTAAPQSQQSTRQALSTGSHDPFMAIPDSWLPLEHSCGQQAPNDFTRYPAPAARSPEFDKGFSFSRPRNVANRDDEDVQMQEAPPAPHGLLSNANTSAALEPQQRTSKSAQRSLPTEDPPTPISKARVTQIPSPPPSQVSASEPKTPKRGATDFKRPSIPASASKDTNSRHVRASSIASSGTLPAPVTPRSQGCGSVTSRTSTSSARKRKIEIDLSSDEEDESDFAPSDDEPDSPEGRQTESKKTKNHAPAPKKAKAATSTASTATGSTSSPALNVPLKNGKNKMGFKSLVKPDRKPSNTSSPSTSNIPSKPPNDKPTPSKPTAPSPITQNPKPSLAPPPPFPSTPTPRPTQQRKAKLQAEDRIHRIHSADQAFWTHQSIVEAEEQEERAKARGGSLEATEKVRRGLRGLSITPGPLAEELVGWEREREMKSVDGGGGGGGGEDVDGDVGIGMRRNSAAWTKWTQDRTHGDRYLSKTQPQTQTWTQTRYVGDDSSDEELDIGE
ncbi:Nn.00g003880.m01.CDS01 [Neocucurbitaria sp. VM-36]